jgi:hypothetical protein
MTAFLRNSHFLSDRVRICPFQSHAAECLPGTRLEVRLSKSEQLAKHILVVLPIPDLAQFAGRVVQLREPSIDVRVTACLWTTVSRSPKFPQPIDQNCLEPSSKSARLPKMVEFAEILGYGQQDFLNKVLRVAVLNVVPSQPRTNQRRIKFRQPIPTLVLRRMSERSRRLSEVSCIVKWRFLASFSTINRIAPTQLAFPHSGMNGIYIRALA